MSGDKCFYCGCAVFAHGHLALRAAPQAQKTRDHVVPAVMGGDGRLGGNVVFACLDCNSVKGDAPAEAFLYFLRNFPPAPLKQRQRAFRQFCYDLARVGLIACLKECA